MKAKKIVSVLVSFILAATCSSPLQAEEKFENQSIVYYQEERDAEIQSLFDERSSQLVIYLNNPDRTDCKEKISDIDKQLEALDVRFMSWDDVRNEFPIEDEDAGMLFATHPDTGVNTWASYYSTYAIDGVVYNVQRLVVQPNSTESPLNISSTSVTKAFNCNWQAGTVNALHTVGSTIFGYVHETPASLIITVFDIIRGLHNDLRTTTVVAGDSITYAWNGMVTAEFAYVRLNNQTDLYQQLAMISTKTEINFSCIVNISGYVDENNIWHYGPESSSTSFCVQTVPLNYGSIQAAVSAYRNNNMPQRAMVDSVIVRGPNECFVQSIPFCHPDAPWNCEY